MAAAKTLWQSAASGEAEQVAALLASGASPNQTDEHCNTALAAAAAGGHVDVVEVLVAAPGIAIEAPNDEGLSPFSQACATGHLDVAELLATLPGVQTGQRGIDGHDPFFRACECGHREVAAWLSTRGAVASEEALLAACSRGHEDVVSWFLDGRHCDVDAGLGQASGAAGDDGAGLESRARGAAAGTLRQRCAEAARAAGHASVVALLARELASRVEADPLYHASWRAIGAPRCSTSP